MEVSSVANVTQELINNAGLTQKNQQPQQSFGDIIADALNEVNGLQVNADKLTQQYLAGETTDIAGVLIATEQANLALQLTVQVRNKIVEAYQEISRMQI